MAGLVLFFFKKEERKRGIMMIVLEMLVRFIFLASTGVFATSTIVTIATWSARVGFMNKVNYVMGLATIYSFVFMFLLLLPYLMVVS